ncbi:MAG: c-type cytochrome [bacterium]|nr:c-type cytochrome [bacterium]
MASPESRRNFRRSVATRIALAVALLAFASPLAAESGGEASFALCAQCHGSMGQGNALYAAPPIAGMAEWYISKQLHKFQDGVRGAHVGDAEGLRMRPMSKFLRSDEQVAAVSAYVAGLQAAPQAATLAGGDPARGKDLYAPCTACHGAEGKGDEKTNGAPLAGLSDWYIYRSLEKFKAGIRGADPRDTDGAVMRGMAMILQDDQAMKDVIAHIQTFSN